MVALSEHRLFSKANVTVWSCKTAGERLFFLCRVIAKSANAENGKRQKKKVIHVFEKEKKKEVW